MTLMKRTNLPESLRNEFFNNQLTPFDNIIDQMFKSFYPDISTDVYSATKHAYPKVNIKEYNDRVILTADIGGLTKDDVDIEVKNDALIIKGNKKCESTQTDGEEPFKWIQKEISNSSFRRVFALSEEVDSNNITAEFKDGLLNIVIPKKVIEAKEVIKKINIK